MKKVISEKIKKNKKKITINPVGRPLKFPDPDKLQSYINNYFNSLKENDIADIESLAEYLDTSRKVLFEYEKKTEYSNAIKKAKNKIASIKKQLAMKGIIPASVFIFDFKNNHDYADRQEIDHTTQGNAIVSTEEEKFETAQKISTLFSSIVNQEIEKIGLINN